MSAPTSITSFFNYVIIQKDTGGISGNSTNAGVGTIRQVSQNCSWTAVNDFVLYDKSKAISFKQGSDAYDVIEEKYVFLKQEAT